MDQTGKWMGGATAATMMAGLTREQNVTFGGWISAAVISQGIGDDQAGGISQDGLVMLQCTRLWDPSSYPYLAPFFCDQSSGN